MSRLTEYGILSACALARKPGELMMVKDLVSRYGLPQAFTRKAMEKLALHGILESVKGPRGGYKLKKKPERTSLLDIILILEEPKARLEMGMKNESAWKARGLKLQPVFKMLHRVDSELTRQFRKISLSMLVEEKSRPVVKAMSKKRVTTMRNRKT